MKRWFSSSIVIAILFLTRCARPAVQLVESDGKTVSSNETIHMNNCGGKDSSEQTAQRIFATQLELNPQNQTGYAVIENMVSGKYGLYKDAFRSQLLKAPPGTNTKFVLTWSEDVYTGDISQGAIIIGQYTVRVPVSVELVSSRDLGCESVVTEDTPQSDSHVRETLTVSFKDGASGTSTANQYSGPVTILVQGKGQASGTQWSDAFYMFADVNGESIEPQHPTDFYNFTLWINGEPADTQVKPIPPFNPYHVYQFTINAPGDRLVFAVGDVYVVDNTGYYTIRILKYIIHQISESERRNPCPGSINYAATL